MSAPRHSPLHEEHEALGATMTDFAGWRMPLHYGSQLTEHTAVRQAAGLFDLSHMGTVWVTGEAAPDFLDHALPGSLSGIAEGRAKYTLMCTPEGGIIDDLIGYRLGPERYLLVPNAANTGVVLEELHARADGFDVTVVEGGPGTGKDPCDEGVRLVAADVVGLVVRQEARLPQCCLRNRIGSRQALQQAKLLPVLKLGCSSLGIMLKNLVQVAWAGADRQQHIGILISGMTTSAFILVGNDIGKVLCQLTIVQGQAFNGAGRAQPGLGLPGIPDIGQCVPSMLLAQQQPGLDQAQFTEIQAARCQHL